MKMIKNMDKVHLYGVMVENMWENGGKENNMEKVYSLNLMENKKKGNGKMEEDQDGQMNQQMLKVTDI